MNDFKQVESMKFWCQKVLPLVYEDSLSYYETLAKVVKKLNDLIENNSKLPDYIKELIESYITSGAIGDVVRNILTEYMLNVKNPPNGLKVAVGDGSADDTQAIQGCIDYANENGGKAVYFPSGVYLTQSLTLKNNVSLVGFDTSTTRVVLKGGATKPMIGGNIKNSTISNITLDGNMDIQVNNIDLIDLIVDDLVLHNVKLNDGYSLIKIQANGCVSGNLLDFGKCVIDALTVTGTGLVNFSDLIFHDLSVLNGRYIINNSVNNAVYTGIHSTANTEKAIYNRSDNSVFTGKIINAIEVIDSVGDGVYTDFYERGGTGSKKLEQEIANRILADNLLQENIDGEKIARQFADNVLQENINAEKLNTQNAIESERISRENADNNLQDNINAEKLARENADISLKNEIDSEFESIGEEIKKIGLVYLQVEEPTIVNVNTVWYEVNGTVNSGSGISIGNAETSDTPPQTGYWFDPIESE